MLGGGCAVYLEWPWVEGDGAQMKHGRYCEKGWSVAGGICSAQKVVAMVSWLYLGGSQGQQIHAQWWLEDMVSVIPVKLSG